MTVMNVVHMRVKPGKDEEYVAIHREFQASQKMKGNRAFRLVKTGDRSYCVIGEWESMADLVAARPTMIGNLDRIRPILEDLGEGRGVTDPHSGEVVLSG